MAIVAVVVVLAVCITQQPFMPQIAQCIILLKELFIECQLGNIFSRRASKEFAWNLFARNLQEVEATDFAVYHFVDKSD